MFFLGFSFCVHDLENVEVLCTEKTEGKTANTVDVNAQCTENEEVEKLGRGNSNDFTDGLTEESDK